MAQPTGKVARTARSPEEKLRRMQQAHAQQGSVNLPRVQTRAGNAPHPLLERDKWNTRTGASHTRMPRRVATFMDCSARDAARSFIEISLISVCMTGNTVGRARIAGHVIGTGSHYGTSLETIMRWES